MRQLLAFIFMGAVAAFSFGAFEPRTASERAPALGGLDGAPQALRQLLTPDGDFDLITLPKAGDWLAVHSEAGHSFSEFLAEKPNRPNGARRVIYLLPIGEFAAGSGPSLKLLSDYAAAYFQLEIRILPAYTPAMMEFDPRVNSQRKQVQIQATTILEFLKTRLPADAFCLLGITMQDLYPVPSWNYVFGQASLRERVGVYSFARHDPDFFNEERSDDYRRLILLRGCEVLVHETAHMFGLKHSSITTACSTAPTIWPSPTPAPLTSARFA